MPLIIEDGTCHENANSYVSLAQADAYLVPRNLWPATEIEEPDKNPDDEDNDGDSNQPGNSEKPEGPPEPEDEDKEDSGNNGNQEGQEAEAFVVSENEGETEPEQTEPESPDSEPELPDNPDTETELPDTSKPDENPDIAKKEAALMRAFDYLNGPLVWKGSKVDWQRMAAWPRENVPIPGCNPKKPEYIPNDIIPEAVCRAQMELAAYIYNGRDMFAPLERGGKYTSKSDSESVDVLSESHSIAYSENAPVEDWLPSIYPLLKPYLDEVPGEVKSAFSVHNVLRG